MKNFLRPSDKLVSKHIRMGNFTFSGKMFCLALAITFVCSAQSTFGQTKAKPTQAEADKLINSANAISFIENKGQWPSNILFHVDVPGGQMSVTPEGMLMGQYDASSFAAVEAYDMKREEAKAKGKSLKDLDLRHILKDMHGGSILLVEVKPLPKLLKKQVRAMNISTSWDLMAKTFQPLLVITN
jgi:hypothetical protein